MFLICHRTVPTKNKQPQLQAEHLEITMQQLLAHAQVVNGKKQHTIEMLAMCMVKLVKL